MVYRNEEFYESEVGVKSVRIESKRVVTLVQGQWIRRAGEGEHETLLTISSGKWKERNM